METIKKSTLLLFFTLSLIALGGCKKEKSESEAPKIEGTWNTTSRKVNGKESFGVWREVHTNPISCNQPGKTVTCVGSKTKLAPCTLVLLNDQTFVWTFSYEIAENDLQKTRANCRCEFEPQYKDEDSFGGSWYTSGDGKTLMLKIDASTLDNYTIVSLEKNKMQLKLIYGQDTYEYVMER